MDENDVVPTIQEQEQFIQFDEQLVQMGMDYQSQFCFDNETPDHKVYVNKFSLSNKLVTNGEYLEFLSSNQYNNCELWLSDGFSSIPKQPMYWKKVDGHWYEASVNGLSQMDLDAPLLHISFFEADAYATFRSCRLPTEAEWELVANTLKIEGQFFDSGLSMPTAA